MDEIIKHFGGKAALAKALNVERSAVSWWLREGLPSRRAVQIERITGGMFKAIEIVGARTDESDNETA